MECPNEALLPAVTPLDIDFFVKQIFDIKSEADEYLDDAPLPAEDASLIEATIPDDARGELQASEPTSSAAPRIP